MSPPHAIALMCVAVSTLVGLVLIGVPAAQSGLLLAFMKAIVEAFRIRALKVALNDDLSVSEVAFASSLVSAVRAVIERRVVLTSLARRYLLASQPLWLSFQSSLGEKTSATCRS